MKTSGVLEVCRGFSRRINAEFGTKDFFEMSCNKRLVIRHVPFDATRGKYVEMDSDIRWKSRA
jgi:hypothetical protein